jgi:hypothetical protein
MGTKLPPLQYEVASNEELEAYLAEPGLKGAALHKMTSDTITQPLCMSSLTFVLGFLSRR